MIKNSLILTVPIAILFGCATPKQAPTETPPPTETPAPVPASSAADLIGFWRLGSGDVANYFQFNEDGTYRMAQREVSNLQDNPQQFGEYTFAEGVLILVSSDESPMCAAQKGNYQVLLLDEGRIGFSLIDDPCSIRSEYWMRTGLEPISP